MVTSSLKIIDIPFVVFQVRNLSDTCSEDTLTFYFENTRRSGGGEIINTHINRDEGYAHLQFKDKSGKVLSRNLLVGLSVCPSGKKEKKDH